MEPTLKTFQKAMTDKLVQIAADAGLPCTVQYNFANVGQLRAGELGETVATLDFEFNSNMPSMFLFNGAKHGPQNDLRFRMLSTDDENIKKMLDSWTELVKARPSVVS